MAKAKKGAASPAVPSISCEDQIKHVLYEMLILAMSLRYLYEDWPKKYHNSKFGPKEVAKGMALIKIRSLVDLLYKAPAPGKDDVVIQGLVSGGFCSVPGSAPDGLLDYRESANKYVAHVTEERTKRGTPRPTGTKPKISRPTADSVLLHGKQVLTICKTLVEECIANGINLKHDKGWAEHYFEAFKEEWALLEAKK